MTQNNYILSNNYIKVKIMTKCQTIKTKTTEIMRQSKLWDESLNYGMRL